MRAAVECAVNAFGALHFAVNNAGIGGATEPAGELAQADWQRVIDINLSGVAHGLRHQIPAILASSRARSSVVVNGWVMGGNPTYLRMHKHAFPAKHGTAKPDMRFRAHARMRKLSNPYMHRNTNAELWMSGKARMRLPGSGEILRCGFP